MKDFVFQTNQNECGFASLKMLLAIVQKDSNYLYLPRLNDDNHQYSLLELKEIAKTSGVLLSGYIINNEHDLLNLKTPFIFVKTLASGCKHAVLVKKIYKSFAYIYDPALGKKIVLSKKYFAISSGVEVLTVESHSFALRNFEIKPLMNNKDKIKILLFEILAVFSYFLSAFFIQKQFDIIIPVILMVAGALLAIVYKASSFTVMKRFDEEYITYTYHPSLKKREENYRLMHKTKSGLLNTTCNIVVTLSSALLVNVILILQNTFTVFVILSSGVLVLIDVMFISPRIKNKSNDLEILERSTLDNEKLSEDQYLNNYSEIKDSTYKIARLVGLKQIIMYFILLILTVLLSQLTGNKDIYFIIFHFAMCMFTYISLDNVYKMVDTNKENQINQVKFYNLINEKREK